MKSTQPLHRGWYTTLQASATRMHAPHCTTSAMEGSARGKEGGGEGLPLRLMMQTGAAGHARQARLYRMVLEGVRMV